MQTAPPMPAFIHSAQDSLQPPLSAPPQFKPSGCTASHVRDAGLPNCWVIGAGNELVTVESEPPPPPPGGTIVMVAVPKVLLLISSLMTRVPRGLIVTEAPAPPLMFREKAGPPLENPTTVSTTKSQPPFLAMTNVSPSLVQEMEETGEPPPPEAEVIMGVGEQPLA